MEHSTKLLFFPLILLINIPKLPRSDFEPPQTQVSINNNLSRRLEQHLDRPKILRFFDRKKKQKTNQKRKTNFCLLFTLEQLLKKKVVPRIYIGISPSHWYLLYTKEQVYF